MPSPDRTTPQPSTPNPRTFVDPDEREPQPGEAHVHHWGADGRCLFPGCSYVVERADSPSPEGAPTVPADWEEGLFDRTHPSNHRILLNGHGNRWCGDCKEWVYLNGRIPPSPEGAEPRTEAQNLLMMLAVNAERAGRDVTVAPVVIFDALREAALPEPSLDRETLEWVLREVLGPEIAWRPSGVLNPWRNYADRLSTAYVARLGTGETE